ncbi:MAG: recombination mediator RecR [Alphaproteobacteria bacterium]
MQDIENLTKILSRLPGFGPRSAKRAVLYILKKREFLLPPLIDALKTAGENIGDCEICGNLDTNNPCGVCSDIKRDKSIICVVEEVSDLWAINRTDNFKGQFHVLGGVLSAIDGITPEQLNINTLISRIESGEVKEVILATNLTVEGQSTSHYLSELLREYDVKITRLANGVPVGGELDYLDDGTLSIALQSRKEVE